MDTFSMYLFLYQTTIQFFCNKFSRQFHWYYVKWWHCSLMHLSQSSSYYLAYNTVWNCLVEVRMFCDWSFYMYTFVKNYLGVIPSLFKIQNRMYTNLPCLVCIFQTVRWFERWCVQKILNLILMLLVDIYMK